MQSLELLSAYLEDGADAIAPSLVNTTDVSAFCQLAQIGALVAASAPRARVCPRCECRVIYLQNGIARCSDCGVIDSSTVDVVRLAPDVTWLLQQIGRTLHLTDMPALPMGNDCLWRLGDIGEGAARRRLFFGHHMVRPEVQRALHASLRTYLGDMQGVLITTTPPELIDDGGLPMPVLWVPAAFRIAGSRLVADEAIWRGVVRPTLAPTAAVSRDMFSTDFRSVRLAGESRSIALTRKQAALFRVLWECAGTSIHGEELMRRVDSDVDKPVDLFKKASYPDANRAYRALIRNHQGDYWMPRG